MEQRRKFFKDFKLEAVNMVLGRGVSIAQVARDLGVNQNVISRWVREFRQGEQHAFSGHGLQKRGDAKVTRLRQEVTQIKMEGGIQKSCGEIKSIEAAKRIIEAWRCEMTSGNPCGTIKKDLTAL